MSARPVVARKDTEAPSMEPTKTILVAVDFEAASMAAIRTAAELARALEGRVVVMHSFSMPRSLSRDLSESLLADVHRQARDAALRPLNDLRSRWGVETMLREGEPATEILRAAEEVHADRIVMGTHGRRGLDRLMLGSVAEAVVRKSQVPVMVVRPAEGPAAPREGKPVVLCATDFQAGSRPVLELAAGFAREIGGTLELVHTYTLPFWVYPGFDAVRVDDLHAETRRWANKTIEALAQMYGAARFHVLDGEAGRTILDVAKEVQPAALVMGTHGRQGLGRFVLGSVAEWVLRRSTFPVLTTHVLGDPPAETQAPPGAEKCAGAA